MPQRFVTRLLPLSILAVIALFAMAVPSAKAAFHQWSVKEAFSNADGSVQFIEMFDSFSNENSINNLTITANSDGVVKTFKFPASLVGTTSNHSLLIATSGFGSLPGGVTPDFTFAQGGVSGTFFDPNASDITIQFSGSSDFIEFSGSSLPHDGIHSLTDTNAHGAVGADQNLVSGVNSPTDFAGNTGSVNVSPEPDTASVLIIPVLGLLGRRTQRRRKI